jgi:inorganic pyrophosphatase
MVDESDIFGGKTWSKEEQLADEMESLKYQIKYTLQSYRKLEKGEWKKIQDFIDGLKR